MSWHTKHETFSQLKETNCGYCTTQSRFLIHPFMVITDVSHLLQFIKEVSNISGEKFIPKSHVGKKTFCQTTWRCFKVIIPYVKIYYKSNKRNNRRAGMMHLISLKIRHTYTYPYYEKLNNPSKGIWGLRDRGGLRHNWKLKTGLEQKASKLHGDGQIHGLSQVNS
jgi:hypothetical protein